MNLTNNEEIEDSEDFRILCTEIFKQAYEDYQSLQHPKQRNKKYLEEEYLNAVDMFWDTEFRFAIQNPDNTEMSLLDMCKIVADRENVDVEKLQLQLLASTFDFWKNKMTDSFSIPQNVIVEHVHYDIEHVDDDEYTIDYETRILYINKKQTEDNHKQFFAAILELICFHKDLRVSKVNRDAMGEALWLVIKMNDRFNPRFNN